MAKNYIVFGAGSGGKRTIQALKQFPNIQVCYCLDNNPKAEYAEELKL